MLYFTMLVKLQQTDLINFYTNILPHTKEIFASAAKTVYMSGCSDIRRKKPRAAAAEEAQICIYYYDLCVMSSPQRTRVLSK